MKLLFCGDISFSSIEHFEFSQDVKVLFDENDLVVGNLEAVITDSGTRLPLHPVHLKTNEEYLDHIKKFNVLCLANNHILDYCEEGLVDTLEILKKSKVSGFGAGRNAREANRPLVISKGNQKLAFIAFTRFANASKNKAGAANSSLGRVLRDIRRLKREGCFVIVMPHWGYEHVLLPSPRQRLLAKKMIRNGTDIILGTHPHIHQGYELIDGKAVFFSLGNYIFSSDYFKAFDNWKLQKSAMVEVEIHDDKSYKFQLKPYHSTDKNLRLLHGNEKELVENEMRQVSKIINGKYLKYLKLYLHDVGFIVDFGRKTLKKQLNKKDYKINKFKKLKKIIKIYSKANWQDVMNRFYKLFLIFLKKVDVSEYKTSEFKNEKLN